MACPLSIAGSQRLFQCDTRSTQCSKLGNGGREGCSQDIKNAEACPLMDTDNYEEGLAVSSLERNIKDRLTLKSELFFFFFFRLLLFR